MHLSYFLGLFSFLVARQTNAELVKTFIASKCVLFFKNSLEPIGLEPIRHARICQIYQKIPRFATLYDRENRIPVYSAFIFRPGAVPCLLPRSKDWYIEPQLTFHNRPPDMMLLEDLYDSEKKPKPKSDFSQPIVDSQATDCDYSASGFDKGPLSLSCFHFGDSQEATFTLTNTVPMYENFYRIVWKKAYENVLLMGLLAVCHPPYIPYVVTGAVPSNRYALGRVNVPDWIWSAVCCTGRGYSIAFIGQNAPNGMVKVLSLKKLEENLKMLYNHFVTIFPSGCY
ncbi:ENDD1 protein, partial [Amia calva]|nr:ENDD1 protein [Amia calva]